MTVDILITDSGGKGLKSTFNHSRLNEPGTIFSAHFINTTRIRTRGFTNKHPGLYTGEYVFRQILVSEPKSSLPLLKDFALAVSTRRATDH